MLAHLNLKKRFQYTYDIERFSYEYKMYRTVRDRVNTVMSMKTSEIRVVTVPGPFRLNSHIRK